jgi:hypothetical protein
MLPAKCHEQGVHARCFLDACVTIPAPARRSVRHMYGLMVCVKDPNGLNTEARPKPAVLLC